MEMEGINLNSKTLSITDIISCAEKIITSRINEGVISHRRFLRRYGISEEKFNTLLRLLKSYRTNLYEEYNLFLRQKNKHDVSILIHIEKLIKNGITLSTGEKRNVELLDYYVCIDLDIKDAISLLIIVHDSVYYLPFFYIASVVYDYIELPGNSLIKMKYKYEKDDEVIEISDAEKEMIIEFLNTNNIPLCENIYIQALRRYSSGTLFNLRSELGLDDEEKRVNHLRRMKDN